MSKSNKATQIQKAYDSGAITEEEFNNQILDASIVALPGETIQPTPLTPQERQTLAFTGLPTNRKALENWEAMNNNQRSQTIQRHCQPQLIDILTKTTAKESTVEKQIAGKTLLASISAATKDSRKVLIKTGGIADANLEEIADLVADQMDDIASMVHKSADMLRQSASNNPASLTYPKAYARILPSADGEGLLRMILGLTEQSKAEKLSTLKRLEAGGVQDDSDME